MNHCDGNGVKLCYERLGDPDDPALVLIMGFSMQLTAWPDEFCDRLVNAGFQVIRFDNRDIGLSGRFTAQADGQLPVPRLLLRRSLGLPTVPPYTLRDMAGDVRCLLDHLQIGQAHVVGASMGGMIGQWFAIDHPERTLSLCSMMSSTGRLRHLFPDPRLIPKVLAGPDQTLEDRIRYGVRFWTAVASPADPPTEQEIREGIERDYRRSSDLSGRDRQLAAIISERSRIPHLRRLESPTLVIHGDSDPLIRLKAGRAVATAIPGASMRVIEGMGHDLRPALIPQLTDLITEHAAMVETPEYQSIYKAIRSIPAGRVSSYGRVAQLAGLPKRARMVGRALRLAPAGLGLPWHRVLKSDGRLAFDTDSEQYREQVARLQAEGVAVAGGRVDLERYGGNLDQLLWGPVEQ